MAGGVSTALAPRRDSGDPKGPGETASSAAYRPHLDGLRAVAVYLVVIYHAGVIRFEGGFIGVDVFFVLSGFLVTQLLLRDVTAQGSIRFGRFYSRRFRRLLPAAFVALIVTAIVYTAISSPAEVSDSIGAFKAAFLYAANWYFIHHSSGYFGADITQNPVLQFWSLAIEEQFYLVWPLTLGGLFLVTRRLDRPRQIRVLQIVVVVGAIASALWALHLRTGNLNRAYYGTDSRAYELLAGAFLALAPTWWTGVRRFGRSVRIGTWISIVALLVLATSWVHLDAIERGIVATFVTGALIVTLETADGGGVKRLLSTTTATYLGRVSYGTYLWHWIVILVVVRTFAPSPMAAFGVSCLIATALASLSYQVLERPVRVSALLDGHRRIVIATGLAISLVAALVIIPKVVDPARAATTSTESALHPRLTPIPKNLDRSPETRVFPNCYRKPVSACTLVKGTGKSILLMGDSHARMLIPAFTAVAQAENLTLSVDGEPACPWQRGLYTTTDFAMCQRLKTDEYHRVIPALRPDIIVVVNLDYGMPAVGVPAKLVNFHGHAATPGELAQFTQSSIAQLGGDKRHVLIVDPMPLPLLPSPAFNPADCLERAKVEEECQYTANTKSSPLKLLYRKLAKNNPTVDTINLDKQICPLFPICNPIVNNEIVKRDQSHITLKFSKTLGPYIDIYMKSIGLLALTAPPKG